MSVVVSSPAPLWEQKNWLCHQSQTAHDTGNVTHRYPREALPPARAGAERAFASESGQLWRLQTSRGTSPGSRESTGTQSGNVPWSGPCCKYRKGALGDAFSCWEVSGSSRRSRQGWTRQSSALPAPSNACPCCWLSLQHIIK